MRYVIAVRLDDGVGFYCGPTARTDRGRRFATSMQDAAVVHYPEKPWDIAVLTAEGHSALAVEAP